MRAPRAAPQGTDLVNIESQAPRQRRGGARRLGEEAAPSADRHSERHGGREQVPGFFLIPDDSLAHERGVRAGEAAEDAAPAA